VTWVACDSSLIHWSDTGLMLAYVGTGLVSSIRIEVFKGVRGVEISLVLYLAEWKLLNRDSLSFVPHKFTSSYKKSALFIYI